LFGGIVLVSTMLMTLPERAHEIGLKMAFGARAWHITVEYLLEAIFIGLVGGLTGLALGVGLSQLLDIAGRTVGMDVFLITDRLARVALGLAAALGALAGALPALKAARIDPDLAIRAQ